jgi:hypothetical protein
LSYQCRTLFAPTTRHTDALCDCMLLQVIAMELLMDVGASTVFTACSVGDMGALATAPPATKALALNAAAALQVLAHAAPLLSSFLFVHLFAHYSSWVHQGKEDTLWWW